jgi:hypothetical protein
MVHVPYHQFSRGTRDSNRRIRYLLQTGAYGKCCKLFQFQYLSLSLSLSFFISLPPSCFYHIFLNKWCDTVFHASLSLHISSILTYLLYLCLPIIWRVQSYNNTLYGIVQVLVTNSNSCFSIGRTYNVGTLRLQFSKGFDAYCTTSTSRYVHVRTRNLASQMMCQARFPMQNVIPHIGRAASLA